MERTIQIPFKIDDEFIDDVLTTCFEGGSNYWICEVKLGKKKPTEKVRYASQVISKDGELLIVGGEEDGKEYLLNLDMFIKGVKKYIKHCIENNREIVLDTSMIDGDIADTILQFALFGDVIYG